MPTELRLSQLSMQFSDSIPQIDADLDVVLGDRPRCDFWGLTETSPSGRVRERVRLACKRHRLHMYVGPGDTTILTRHQVFAHGSHLVHPGRPGPASEGGHGPRYIEWVGAAIGHERVYFHEAHWLAHLDTVARRLDHARMTRAMVRLVAAHGPGRRLSFFGGDVNVDEATDTGARRDMPEYLFSQGGLETIWDDLKRTPPTHGRRTIDIVGRYLPDVRVTPLAVRVFPLLHSDHRQVIATYAVR